VLVLMTAPSKTKQRVRKPVYPIGWVARHRHTMFWTYVDVEIVKEEACHSLAS
jgi:hypothetical protein